jgi:predicted Zn-dependent protease
MLLIEQDRSPDEALQLVKPARAQIPRDAKIMGTHACALFVANQTDAAAKALADAVRVSPNDAWVRYCYGKLLLENGDREAAESHLEGCLILDPNFARRTEIQRLLQKS